MSAAPAGRLHRLRVLPGRLAVCRLALDAPLPAWVFHAEAHFFSVTRTPDEISVVCAEDDVPPSIDRVERGWRALMLEGTIPFSEVGVLASLLAPLAQAGVPVFALSTHDTDYVLVQESDLACAVAVLRERFEIDAGS
ncbi:MAG: ACT domain-containing protein [Candidatus Eisenbacteria bacterium]|nr:ACT domain-containing protein [Candidatus Eisenbacteria bacterium]